MGVPEKFAPYCTFKYYLYSAPLIVQLVITVQCKICRVYTPLEPSSLIVEL